MNFTLNDEQRMLVDAAGRYVRDNCDLETRRKIAKTPQAINPEHWRQFAEMGWLALTLPERVGGLELGTVELALLQEELGRGLVNEPLVDSTVLCAQLLVAAQTQAADSALAEIATGETIAALAHVENNGRSELDTAVDTRAEPTKDGWCITGIKHRVFHGPSAHLLLVSASTEGGEECLFAVPADKPGISLKSYELIDGSKASDVTLENVNIPADGLLLRGQEFVDALALAIDKSIIALCAAAVGSMEAVMWMTAEYLKTRHQYGKPLAQFQALQHRMSEMLVETEQARSALYRALALWDDPAQRPPAVSTAKVLISQGARWVTSQGIQLHGGIGTTEEYAVGHHYKAALTLEQRFGDSDWHLDRCDPMIDQQEV